MCETLAKGGFKLCKFRSSSSQVLSSIDQSLRERLPVQSTADNQTYEHPKALWDSQNDNMSIAINLSESVIPTKRGIISDISKTFDILGWMAPSIIKMKVLYQKLWMEKLGWDDPVPSELLSDHAEWKKQLHLLNHVKLDRCYYRVEEPPLTIQLHGFSDASELAYSAVVYIRSIYSNSLPFVKLVSAKPKVAPLKTLSIPRLELSC